MKAGVDDTLHEDVLFKKTRFHFKGHFKFVHFTQEQPGGMEGELTLKSGSPGF